MGASTSLRAASIDRIAAGWTALGGQLEGDPDATLVDPEALIAATAELARVEDRILGVALDWCVAYGDAVNSSRLRRIARAMNVTTALSSFAAALSAAGGPTWSAGAGAATPMAASLRGKVAVRDLSAPARLVWRLRSAFGVNARADILALLLSCPAGTEMRVVDIARRTGFSKRNAALAIESMRLAGVVETDRKGNSDRVALPVDSPLRAFLPRPVAAPDWIARWTVASEVLRLDERLASAPDGAVIVEERLAAESLGPKMRDAGLPRPDLTVRGPAFAGSFDAWMGALATVLSDLAQ
jgi:hypothetical protein